jgi:CHAT domain-containing protein
MASYPCLRLLVAGCAFAILINIAGTSVTVGQTASNFEDRTARAYQKFHHGEVRNAAKEIRSLANETTDEATKARLLRDLAEICVSAIDAGCVMQAQAEAFELSKKNEALKDIIPDLYAYFIKAQLWIGNKEVLSGIFKDGKLNFYSPGINPPAAALAHLAASAYFVAREKYSSAETEYSIALLCLLLTNPKNRYAISNTIVEMLGVLIAQQDIVGAHRLIRVADTYLTTSLNHEGPIWAQYVYLATDLVAITKRHKDIVPALAEAARLNQRQDINDGIKLYRIGTSNDLQTLLLILEGKEKEAADIHALHPLQPRRQSIIQQGHFENVQELFFAVSDVVVQSITGTKGGEDWKPLLLEEFPANWQLTDLLTKNFDSYRKFALGVIESSHSKKVAAQLYQSGARERIDVFEVFSKHKFEGFQLPTVMDSLVVRTALASLAEFPDADQFDLMLRGSEVLLRTLRHQLSDFSVLIGSQTSERARASARSYNLLQQQKRDWEFREIEKLLKGGDTDKLGALISTYSKLVASVSLLKDRFAKNQQYVDTIGYPDTKQIQSALREKELFVTYVPTFRGIGRLCISKDSAVSSFSDVDTSQLTVDVRLMKLALTADYAADEMLDSQFPAASAFRLQQLLFGGLGQCLQKGAHINAALPDEVAGIPLAALLAELPHRLGEGFDLKTAKWLGNEFTFSTFVSARHFLGTQRSLMRTEAAQPYLGIGNPKLAKAKTVRPGSGVTNQADLHADALGNLVELPETSDELRAAQKLFGERGEILLGAAASEEAFRSKDLGKYDVVHFATHGLLGGDVEGLTEPALVLTPVEQTDSFDDGLLTTSEITRFTLNARLIILSACNTARIDTNAANIGATDLQAAFSVAGAPTLVAALWTVETKTARDIVIEFLKSWQSQTNKNASLALAIATRGYLKSADRAHQHPRFWAPFVVLGYGSAIDFKPVTKALDIESLQALPENTAGEIVDAKVFRDKLIVSMQGDWDGHSMASIVKDPFSATGSEYLKTHDIGAGQLFLADASLYITGYRTSDRSFPILRKLEHDGRMAWEKDFEKLAGYTFADGRYVDGSILLLAEPIAEANEKERRVVILKLDLDGKELSSVEILAPRANLLIGKKSIFGKIRDRLAVVLNSQATPGLNLDPEKLGVLGMGTWCQGALQASIYLVDTSSLVVSKLTTFDNYQISKVDKVGSRTVIGGQNREPCSDAGAASLTELRIDGSRKMIWTDDDPFPSSVESFDEAADGLAILVRRQRPLGVRVIEQTKATDGSKRWGDDGVEMLEFSVLKIDSNGKSLGQYDSTFGISAFAQGIVHWHNKVAIFGGLGGRPAISRIEIVNSQFRK